MYPKSTRISTVSALACMHHFASKEAPDVQADRNPAMEATARFAEPEADVNIELYTLDGNHQFFFDVDHYVTIGQIAKKFEQALFDKYQSNDVFESYTNSVIAFVSPGGKPRKFNLWESDVQLIWSTEICEFLRKHNMQPLRFQLIRLPTPPWQNPWKGKTTDWMEAGNYLQEALAMCSHIKNDTRKLHELGNAKKKP